VSLECGARCISDCTNKKNVVHHWKIPFCNKGKQNTIYTIFISNLYNVSLSCFYFMQVFQTSFQNRSHVNTTDHNIIQMYKFPKSAVLDIREKRKYKYNQMHFKNLLATCLKLEHVIM
jgi:hypothetical protein